MNRYTIFSGISEDLPVSITEIADPNKRELWITLDQLEQRTVLINSLSSKNTYKSVFRINKNVKQTSFSDEYSKPKYACSVSMKEESLFMINLSVFTYTSENVSFSVFTNDKDRQKIDVNFEILHPAINYNPEQKYGEAKTSFFQRFKLQPNTYIFQFELLFNIVNAEEVDLLLEIGSVTECTFKEFINEAET